MMDRETLILSDKHAQKTVLELFYTTNLNLGQTERVVYSFWNWLGDVGGFFGVIWAFGSYMSLIVSKYTLAHLLTNGVFKTKFDIKMGDLMPCRNKRQKNKGLKGLRVIDENLDVANFIRFNLQTRGLLKQLFDSEKRRAAKDFKNHIDSD